MDLATAKALLQRQEGAGSNLYEHLTDILLKIITEQPASGLEHFEQISASVKALRTTAPEAAPACGTQSQEAKEHLLRQDALFRTGEDAPAASEPVQDLLADAALLEWGAISFGRTATYQLGLSLRKLAAAKGLRGVRLWGKLLGLSGDYFVAESLAEEAEEAPEGALDALGNAIHRPGEGPNKYTYWVCGSPEQDWTALPNVTPHQVVAARAVRRYLSGSLAAPVRGHPPFPGNEAAYARALIALISAATVLAPAGAFVPSEGDDTGAISPAEEWDSGAVDQRDASAWVHLNQELNALGRTAPNPPKIGADGEELPDDAAPPASELLKPINDDPPTQPEAAEGGAAWDIRPAPALPSGCIDASAPVGSPTGPAAVVLRSNAFPGAVTVGAGKRYVSIYVGYGHAAAWAPYAPQLPPAAPAEWSFEEEGRQVREEADIKDDPDAGKQAAGEEGEGAAEGEEQ